LWVVDRIEDLFPSTPLGYLIYLGVFVLLSVAMIFWLARMHAKKPKKQKKEPVKKELTLDDLLKIVNKPDASAVDLITALELFIQNFKVKDDEKKSLEFFKKLLNHKNRNKMLFNVFHGKVIALNPEYKDVLDKLERAALNK